MPGSIGEARSNDIVPNGPIVPIPDMALPGTLNLATYASYGSASVLNCICTGAFSVAGAASDTATDPPAIPAAGTGLFHAAAVEVYLPVNGQSLLKIGGTGTFSSTLYTLRYRQ